MPKRVVIAAGGTGGHLFPAQALARELLALLPGTDILFMAKGLRENNWFSRDQFSYVDVNSSTVSLNPRAILRAAWSIPLGVYQSMNALRKFDADLVVGFGSFHTFPVLCAARLLNIPIVLHVADCVPGRVNRLFASKAAWTGVFFPEAKNYLKGTIQRTSIPLRAHFYAPQMPAKQEAIQLLGLSPEKKTILVFGGSQGAKKLNEVVAESVLLQDPSKIQVIHFTGRAPEVYADRYARAGISAIVRPFEPNMHYPWAAADLVIARSGASTIAESIAFTVPAVLVPYPHATDQHQDKNARYAEEIVGSARRLEEKNLTADVLRDTIDELLSSSVASKIKQNILSAQEALKKVSFSQQIAQYLSGEKVI